MTDKKTFKTTIAMSEETMAKWNKLLAIRSNDGGGEVFLRDRGYDEDSTHDAYTAYFENGFYADIKLCAGQSNFFGDAVLFNKDGNEVCVLDCFDDINIGDTFEFSFDERIYVAEIIQGGCRIYGAEYPNHINYYYVTDVNGDVYGDGKLRHTLAQVPDGVKIVKVENTNHPDDSAKDEIDYETEDGTIDITHEEHMMVDFSDMLHIEKKRNFIVCDCCQSKIGLGETYHILKIACGETHFNCTRCITSSVLEERDIENFWMLPFDTSCLKKLLGT